MLAQKCGTGGCHDASATAAAMLNLATASGLAMRVMGVPAKSSCVGRPLLDTANTDNSVLVSKITGTTCGQQMPPIAGPLSATEIDCVKRWAASPGCSTQ